MKLLAVFALLFATSFLTACHKSIPASALSTAQSDTIVNGHDVTQGSKYQKHVVAIYDYQDEAICTGTLIPGNIIVTAAHCMVNPAHKMKVIFGLDAYDLAHAREQDVVQLTQRTITSYKVHPDYNETLNEDKETNWHDIAIVKFSGSLPQGYAPAKLLTTDADIRRGVMMTLVGYGVSKVDVEDVEYSRSKEFQEGLEYGEILCDDNDENCIKINQSGDGLLRYTQAPVLGVQESEFRLDERKSGTCSGDSGGPAFVTDKNGEFLLAGVTSRGNLTCDDQGVYTSVAIFTPWIEKTIPQLR